jgi:hypothetical protein
MNFFHAGLCAKNSLRPKCRKSTLANLHKLPTGHNANNVFRPTGNICIQENKKVTAESITAVTE